MLSLVPRPYLLRNKVNVYLVSQKIGSGNETKLCTNGSKWLNNISRDLQTVFSGRGTRTTKLRMRMLRSLKSTIALVRKDFM